VFPQLEKTIEEEQTSFDYMKERLFENFGEELGFSDIAGMDDQQRLVSAYFSAVASGNTEAVKALKNLFNQQRQLQAATNEYKQQQQDILKLQEAQADLKFLEQQTKLLDMIKENGLNAGAILGGLELGLDADANGVMQAMTRAVQAMIEQAENELGIASPSKVFAGIGENVTAGLVRGITGGQRMAEAAMASIVQPPRFTPTAAGVGLATAGAALPSSGGDIFHFHFGDIGMKPDRMSLKRDIETTVDKAMEKHGRRADVIRRGA
jgi:hypothetical protein